MYNFFYTYILFISCKCSKATNILSHAVPEIFLPSRWDHQSIYFWLRHDKMFHCVNLLQLLHKWHFFRESDLFKYLSKTFPFSLKYA